MKEGESYERLAMKLFSELLAQTDIPSLRIEHDAEVQGKTGRHQIDVLWEFKHGGIRYLTLIQAKDWSKPVDQGEILKFRAVLDDVPGQPRGLMVSREGYQSGAEDIARAHGIKLYQLRESTAADRPRGRIAWDFEAYLRKFENVTVDLDQEWMKEEGRRLGLPSGSVFDATFRLEETQLVGSNGEPLGRLNGVVASMFPVRPGRVERQRNRTEFPGDMFLVTPPGSLLPRVRIRAIEADIWTQEVKGEVSVGIETFSKHLLIDVLEGSATSFSEQGKRITVVPVIRRDAVQWIRGDGLS